MEFDLQSWLERISTPYPTAKKKTSLSFKATGFVFLPCFVKILLEIFFTPFLIVTSEYLDLHSQNIPLLIIIKCGTEKSSPLSPDGITILQILLSLRKYTGGQQSLRGVVVCYFFSYCISI